MIKSLLLFLLLFFTQSIFAAYYTPPGSITLPKLANESVSLGLASNYSLTATTASNAMTVTLKDFNGSNLSAPMVDLAKFFFRPTTLTSSVGTYQAVSSNLSIVVPQLATLGLVSGSIPQYVWVYTLNDSGTVDLCVSGSVFSDQNTTAVTQISSTATNGSVLYCSLAHASTPAIRLIGRIKAANATNTNWTSITQVDTGRSGDLAKLQPAFATVKEVEASGVGAQSIASGSYVTRILNTVCNVSNTCATSPTVVSPFVTLSANQFTLVPGTYSVRFDCPFQSNTTTLNTKCKLRNVTTSSDVVLSQGSSNFLNNGATGAGSTLMVSGTGSFTITAANVFEIDQRVSSTATGGQAVSLGDSEIYTQVEIRKLDYYGP